MPAKRHLHPVFTKGINTNFSSQLELPELNSVSGVKANQKVVPVNA